MIEYHSLKPDLAIALVDAKGVQVIRDRIAMTAEVVVRVTDAVERGGLDEPREGFIGAADEGEGFLAGGQALLVVPEQEITPADVVERSGRTDMLPGRLVGRECALQAGQPLRGIAQLDQCLGERQLDVGQDDLVSGLAHQRRGPLEMTAGLVVTATGRQRSSQMTVM